MSSLKWRSNIDFPSPQEFQGVICTPSVDFLIVYGKHCHVMTNGWPTCATVTRNRRGSSGPIYLLGMEKFRGLKVGLTTTFEMRYWQTPRAIAEMVFPKLSLKNSRKSESQKSGSEMEWTVDSVSELSKCTSVRISDWRSRSKHQWFLLYGSWCG